MKKFEKPKLLVVALLIMLCAGCTTPIANKKPIGQLFPAISGTGLDGQEWKIPADLKGKSFLLLIGYVQDTQFDIDRWLIGIDQLGLQIDILEVPTIRGWIPGLIADRIDEGMRQGIPKDLWKIVVTVYQDADQIVDFTGNTRPRNARAIVLDDHGKVVFFHDDGFSVAALDKLAEFFPRSKTEKCQ